MTHNEDRPMTELVPRTHAANRLLLDMGLGRVGWRHRSRVRPGGRHVTTREGLG